MQSKSVLSEETTSFTEGKLCAPTKDGYAFDGWYDNADFNGTAVIEPAAGGTYYAKWAELAITFNSKTGEEAVTYDGTAKTLTATLENTPTATFTYTYALRTNAEGDGTYAEATATAPTNAGYYKVIATLSGSERTATAYLEIKSADITAIPKAVAVQQGDTTMQQFDLSTLELTPNLAAIGAVTYSIESTKDTNGILDGDATIVDGKLQFKLKEIVNSQHTASIAVAITPISGNYKPVVATVVIQITKDTVAPTMTANPVSGASSIIRTDGTILVTFSKKMIGTPIVEVKGGDGTATATLSNDALSMTVSMKDLAYGSVYNFTINGLKDIADNVLENCTLTYTTAVAPKTDVAVPKIDGDNPVIDGNNDAIPKNISILYTPQVATNNQTILETSESLPNGFEKTDDFFRLSLAIKEVKVDNPVLNRPITITVPSPVVLNNTYKVAHLKADGSVEILDAIANYSEQTLSFTVTSFSPFMVLSKYDAPSGGGGGGGSSYDYYDIKVTKEGNGTISPDGGSSNSISVREWSDKMFTFTPDKGYVVSDVLVDGTSIGAKASYTFENVRKDHTIKVIFKQINTHVNPQTGVAFEDVQESDWFVDSVYAAVGNGWFSGTSKTTFSPYGNTTRGMIATVLWRMEKEPTASVVSIFEDVANGAYYADGTNWAQTNGIVGGYGNGKFGPQDNITREQMASILYRYAQFKGYDVSKTKSLGSFADGGTTSDYAKVPMAWAIASGLISGKGNGILDPKVGAIRAEVAAILTRFDELFSSK